MIFGGIFCLVLLNIPTWGQVLTNGSAITYTLDKFGIGTSTPENKLQIYNQSTIGGKWNPSDALLQLTDGGTTSLIVDANEIYCNKNIYLGSMDKIKFRTITNTEPTNHMVINSSGRVSIGDITPDARLHLYEINGGNTLMVDTEAGGKPNIRFATEGVYKGNIRINDDDILQICTGKQSTDRAINISPDNKIGIGTADPQNDLDIIGVTSSDEFLGQEVRVKLKNDWPDYVFCPDYELPSLAQEAQHIQAKGHLSGFQSAEEMNGEIQLGDVTKRQQVKIEEMMLHMIALNERLEKLEKENARLKRQSRNY